MNIAIKRIAVIGISASGKSVFAKKLAEKSKLPLIHMDQIFWRGNWEEVPEAEYLKKHQEIIQQGSWIIEGYIEENMADRLKLADLVIYLDFSGARCAWWVIKRWLAHRKESRPELSSDAFERFKWNFFWRVLTRKERIRIESVLIISKPANIVRLKTPDDLEIYLKKF